MQSHWCLFLFIPLFLFVVSLNLNQRISLLPTMQFLNVRVKSDYLITHLKTTALADLLNYTTGGTNHKGKLFTICFKVQF